jgi:hypothetical protein
MNCSDHEHWLQGHLDGKAEDTNVAAAEHRAACATCCAMFAAAQRMLAALGRLPSAEPPAGLASRIVGCILADRRRVIRYRRVLVAGSLAASLLLAVLAALPFLRPGGATVTVVRQPAEASLEENIQEMTAAVVELTRRTTDETVGQTRLLLPAIVPELPAADSQMMVMLDPPAQSLREVQASVSEGLEPVTTSWRRAVDLFRRNIPPMGASE